jgi:hypothetical protein
MPEVLDINPTTTNESHLFRLRKMIQIIPDLSGRAWRDLRILDLGSYDGDYAIEFAVRGAHVVAIEGRGASNEIAKRVAASRGVSQSIQFVTGDVRNLLRETYGAFDVVLCSGILYHLQAQDGCRLLQTIAGLCNLLIIDTHVGITGRERFEWKGKVYYGIEFREHSAEDTAETKAGRVWSSLDQETSFWVTKSSLLNLLNSLGFTTVAEILRPIGFLDYSDRITLAAIKGSLQTNALQPDYPENLKLSPHPGQARYFAPPPRKPPVWNRALFKARQILKLN